MNAVQTLMAEHRVIESVLAALTAYARSVANGGDAPRADLAELVQFLQDYADAYHHGKEEDILFRAMVDQGMPVDGGPLAVMLAEHAEGRRLTRSLAEISSGEGAWNKEQRRRLLFDATSYARLLKEHIQKEDRVLYPMATQMLPDDVWRKIEAEFADFQSARQRADQAAQFEQLAESLVGRYVADDGAS
jgi:hemerythrin-like domain-containing protein